MDDLISRQAAIDALDRIGSLDTEADKKYARSVFEALPSAQPEQSWIPCSEKLPEKDVEILVTTKRENLFIAENSSLFSGWITEDGVLSDFDILAWQPLPKPYKEEKPDER